MYPIPQSHKFNFKSFNLSLFTGAWLTTPYTKEWEAIEANHAKLKDAMEGETFDVELNYKKWTALFYIKRKNFLISKLKRKFYSRNSF